MTRVIGWVATAWLSTVIMQSAMAQAPFSATVQMQLQQQPSVAEAWVDLGLLDGTEIHHVAVRSADDAAKLLPARIQKTRGDYQVLWQVPAMSGARTVGTVEKFVLELGAAAPSPVLTATESNLLHNGDFEQPAEVTAQVRLDQEAGNHYLSFGSGDNGSGTIYLLPRVAVNGRENYTVSYRYRVKGGKPDPEYHLTFYSWIYFYDAEGKPLASPRTGGTFEKSADTGGWQSYSTTVAMPADARFAMLELRASSTVPWSVAIDDLRFAPATGLRITDLKSDQGKTISLQASGADIRRFDLGPTGAPVWRGYASLTPDSKYDPKIGWGLTQLEQPLAVDTHRPDALRGDFISALKARLRVDLPKGKYRVWLTRGDSQLDTIPERFYFTRSFTINGREMIEPGQSPTEFFLPQGDYWRYYRAFWTPGMDFYDTMVASHFQRQAFDAQVETDHLELEWRYVPMDAIVIAPADQADAMERELTSLDGQLRQATSITQMPDPIEPVPGLSQADQERGFLLFHRPASERVYPFSRPKAGEQIKHLEAFAARGQFESVRFSLLPLKDLGGLSVVSGDLSNGSNTIPASAVDIRVERYIFHSADDSGSTTASRGNYQYQIAPFPLDHRANVPANKGITWSWWATIRVPDNAPAGIYTGALTIKSEHGQTVELPLRLRVLSYKLSPLPIVQGYFYFPAEPWYSTFWGANRNGPSYRDEPAINKMIANNEERELEFMKDLGLNSAAFMDDARGDWKYKDEQVSLDKDSRFALWMDLYARAGMKEMPYYGFCEIGPGNQLKHWLGIKDQFSPPWNQAYRSIPQNVNALAGENGWPPILWYISDEASNGGDAGAEQAARCAQLLEGQKGVRTIASMNGRPEHILPPHVSISMPNFAFPITDQTIAMIRKDGSEFWIYNCGDERLMLGLYPWRIDARGRFQWCYSSMVGNPWDDLDGKYPETAYDIVLPGPDGPVGTLRSEALRAAINDHRYIATLQAAIASAADNPDMKQTVAQAHQFLADLRNRIPVDAAAMSQSEVDQRATGGTMTGQLMNADALDRIRWAAAELILKLHGEQ